MDHADRRHDKFPINAVLGPEKPAVGLAILACLRGQRDQQPREEIVA